MDLQKTVRKGALAIRVPMEVIRQKPTTVKHVLALVMDLPKEVAGGWEFFRGWEDPRTSGIIILAQPPDHNAQRRPPVLLECTRIRTYRTLVTVYDATPRGSARALTN